MLIFCYFFLFFFKQKTAYELRISDWSSDVRSSDLLSRIAAAMTGPATIDWYGMGNGSLPASIQALAHLLAIIRAGLPVIDRLTTVSPSPPSAIDRKSVV